MSFDPTAFSFATTPASPAQSEKLSIPKVDYFYYFAYGSCMCPVDLQRTIGVDARSLLVGRGLLRDHRLAFNRRSPKRQTCGVLDIVPDPGRHVEGVLYQLPWQVSDRLDEREEVPSNGYRQETVSIECGGKLFHDVRTYVVVHKTEQEVPPDDWYFYVVMRGAMTAGLSCDYSWQLFTHMKRLQRGENA
jgi:cation transport regulator ChaC